MNSSRQFRRLDRFFNEIGDGTIRLTNPARRFLDIIIRPVRHSSIALDLPIAGQTLCAPARADTQLISVGQI